MTCIYDECRKDLTENPTLVVTSWGEEFRFCDEACAYAWLTYLLYCSWTQLEAEGLAVREENARAPDCVPEEWSGT